MEIDDILREIAQISDREADAYMAKLGTNSPMALLLREAYKGGIIRAFTLMAERRNA